MEVSNSYNRYDSTINASRDFQRTEAVKKPSTIKQFLSAFKIELSQKALNSKEYNDPKNNFPIHNQDALQYSENLNIILK